MRHSPIGTKWCHIRWLTYRRREHFKIAETARFCERAIPEACSALGWSVDTVAVLPDGVQLLALAPAGLTRDRLLEQIRNVATQVARQAGVRVRAPQRVWEDSWWCAVLTNAAAVAAVRRHIEARGRSSQATAPVPTDGER